MLVVSVGVVRSAPVYQYAAASRQVAVPRPRAVAVKRTVHTICGPFDDSVRTGAATLSMAIVTTRSLLGASASLQLTVAAVIAAMPNAARVLDTTYPDGEWRHDY